MQSLQLLESQKSSLRQINGQTATRPSSSNKRFAFPKLRLQAIVLVRSHIAAHPPSEIELNIVQVQ
jgi:hypothetical protein